MYVIRGAAFGKRLSTLEIYNIAFTLACDALIYKFMGLKALIYLGASLWIGYSFHPAAAHFIQEHYTYSEKQETYSYYGPLNWVFLNIGYHNEHHDFPKVCSLLTCFFNFFILDSLEPSTTSQSDCS
jgi:sphingolipid 4-desaturase/C4-monooxygenase